MPRIRREESEKRIAAVLKFFRENPRASGEDAQKALREGKLTGRREVPLGRTLLFRLQREAAQRRDGAPRSEAPTPRDGLPLLTGEQYELLKKHANALHALLVAHAGDIIEVRITREGAKVTRAKETSLD